MLRFHNLQGFIFTRDKDIYTTFQTTRIFLTSHYGALTFYLFHTIYSCINDDVFKIYLDFYFWSASKALGSQIFLSF